MKKLICLFTILAFLGVANSMAQGLHFGLKAGVLGNKANVSGMRNQFKEESLTGFQVGPMLQYQTGFHGIALDFFLLYSDISSNELAITAIIEIKIKKRTKHRTHCLFNKRCIRIYSFIFYHTC